MKVRISLDFEAEFYTLADAYAWIGTFSSGYALPTLQQVKVKGSKMVEVEPLQMAG